jgi:hypothetical protein
VLEELGLP